MMINQGGTVKLGCHGSSNQKQKDTHTESGHRSYSNHSPTGHGLSHNTLHWILMLIVVGVIVYNVVAN